MKIEKTIDRESKLKLYVQIYAIIKEKIENAEWPAGTQIPTEDELCKTYDVSKVTVREAIQELVREGFLKRQQGKGTFVTYSVPHLGLIMRTRLSDVMHGEGVTVRKEILERGSREPSGDIKTVLMTGGDIYYVLCKKSVDGDSYIEELFIPLFVLPDIDDEDILYKSFLDVIEEKGSKKISRVLQTMEVTRISGYKAVLLEMKEGSPVLDISRILISSDGSPIACTRHVGSNKVQMEFERIK